MIFTLQGNHGSVRPQCWQLRERFEEMFPRGWSSRDHLSERFHFTGVEIWPMSYSRIRRQASISPRCLTPSPGLPVPLHGITLLSRGVQLGSVDNYSQRHSISSLWTWFSRIWQSATHWKTDATVVFWVYCEMPSYLNTQHYFQFSFWPCGRITKDQQVVHRCDRSHFWGQIT